MCVYVKLVQNASMRAYVRACGGGAAVSTVMCDHASGQHISLKLRTSIASLWETNRLANVRHGQSPGHWSAPLQLILRLGIALQAAYELGVALWENNRLLEFRYGGNSLHGIAAAALLGGGKFDDQGLKHSGSLKRLHLQVC